MRPWAARTSCTAASTDAWACDVQGYRAGCTDGFGCLLGRLGAAVGDHDGRSLDAEGLGDRRADPSGATDDERHLAGQDWPNGAHGVLTGGIRSPCDSVRAAARWGVSPKLSGFEARQADNVQLLRPGRDRHRDLDLALTDVLPAAGFTANEVLALVAGGEDSWSPAGHGV